MRVAPIKNRRRRAVALTPEAIDLLKTRLLDQWRLNAEGQKLTREKRAQMLGLSIGTAERILRGEGVDRPSLLIAFQNIGLQWKEEFCSDDQENAEFADVHVASMTKPESSTNGFRIRSQLWIACVAIAVLIGFFWMLPRYGQTESWSHRYHELIRSGTVAYNEAKYEQASHDFNAALEIARNHDAAQHLSDVLRMLGDVAAAQGSLKLAKQHYSEALTLRRILRHTFNEPAILEALGSVEARMGEFSEAEDHLTKCLEGYTAQKDGTGIAMAYRSLGSLAVRQKEYGQARRLFQAGLSTLSDLKKPDLEADILGQLAVIDRDQGHYSEALEMLDRCLSHWRSVNHPRWIATTQLNIGAVEYLSGNLEKGIQMVTQSKAAYQELGDAAGVAEADSWLKKMVQ